MLIKVKVKISRCL